MLLAAPSVIAFAFAWALDASCKWKFNPDAVTQSPRKAKSKTPAAIDADGKPSAMASFVALVDLNSVHQYRPPHAAGGLVKGRTAASKRGASTTSHEPNDPEVPAPKSTASADLEYVDLTDSLAIEAVGGLLGEPALGLGETERYVQDSLLTGPSLTAGNEQNNGPLPSLEELLRRDVGYAYEPQHAMRTIEHRSESADGAIEHPTPNDCEEALAPGPARDGDMR